MLYNEGTYHGGDTVEEIAQPLKEEETIQTYEFDNDSETVYHCSPCGVDFQSIAEHFQEYHADEPVVADMVDSTAPVHSVLQSVEYNFDDLIEEDVASDLDDEPVYVQVYDDYSVNETIPTALDHVAHRTCTICKTVFSSKQSLRIHMRMHSQTKHESSQSVVDFQTIGGRIRCADCSETFSIEQTREHAESHRRKKDHLCTVCNKRFTSYEVLVMHMQNHTEAKSQDVGKRRKKCSVKRKQCEGKLSYPCRYCGKEFFRPYEKVEHERIHTGEKPFPCQICGKTFRVSHCLKLHLRTHLDRRPYTCAVCQKSFSSNSGYTHHVLTHSDERKFECTVCGKSFKTLVQLAGHRKSHTRPFACSECNRPFASLYALRSHMEFHRQTDKLAFACNICGAMYGKQLALRDHQAQQHNCNTDLDDANNEEISAYFSEEALVAV